MFSSIEIITTPTADTPGTSLVLRTPTKHYVFGNLAEGTQRATVQQSVRLAKAQDFFLTGRSNWNNTGGLIGMMLTLADATTSSYQQSMETQSNPKFQPEKPRLNLYGPPNLKHLLGTCRRYIFRKGVPLHITEYSATSLPGNSTKAPTPTFEDTNIQVWALAVKPDHEELEAQAEETLEAARAHFDDQLNNFEEHQAPENETKEDREKRYDQIRTATIKYMFDSNWSFDTLVERHISEVEMPSALFVRNPDSHGYEPYRGPMPGGSVPLPDIKVFTRTPWPGAKILALPPTRPILECISYIVRSQSTRGTFDVARAKALGVKPGPAYGKLTAGKSVQNQDGEWIKPDQVLGPDRQGQGVAILEIPTPAYIQGLLEKDELKSPEIMAGIGAVIWILGPGVVGHPSLTSFMKTMDKVEHIISSPDTSPNRIALDSVAGQATRLSQIDPARYSTPIFDDSANPQKILHAKQQEGSEGPQTLPEGSIKADRGISFSLMPKFARNLENVPALFNSDEVRKGTIPEILELSTKAHQSIYEDQEGARRWRELIAHPNTEITTLGTGSALPSKYRNVSATLVRVPGIGNYLLDCGENTLGQLARVFPHEELVEILTNLRVIWISHLHADHHLGTASVIRAWYNVVHKSIPNKEPLDTSLSTTNEKSYGLSVISHEGMLQWLREYSSIEDFGYSRILPLQISYNERHQPSLLRILNTFGRGEGYGRVNDPVSRSEYTRLFGFSDIQAAKVAHCHGAMAVSMTFPSSPVDPPSAKPLKVSYSGDCRPSHHFSLIGRDSTVLIHEATFDDEMAGDAKAKKHSTTSEALEVGAKMNAKAVVLTHFSQRYQKIPVLRTVGGEEEPAPVPEEDKMVEEDEEIEDAPDNMDVHTTSAIDKTPTTSNQNKAVIAVRNANMKVAIAFDYMRVKIGDVYHLEKFNEALNVLLSEDARMELEVKEEEKDLINANGKKMSGDEAPGSAKKSKKQKSKRNN